MAAVERENIPPATLPVDPDGIPDELKVHTQFLNWDWEFRGDKWTKPPLRVSGSGYAKSNDPATWGPFAAALAAYQQRDLAGIGFALSPDDDFFFIDLDHCRSPETGEIARWARPILRLFRHTYQEISPTGTGVKIIGYGRLAGSRHVKHMAGSPGAKIEVFDRDKYTTLTGHRYQDASPTLSDCQAALDSLEGELFAPDATSREEAPVPPVPGDDDARRLERARAAKNGAEFVALFDQGDTSPYGGDDSSADQALCNHLAFWFGPDRARIDRVFRLSALMRPKWDKKHHGDGRTYGEGTIDTALAGRTEFYQPRQPRLRVVVGGQDGADNKDGSGGAGAPGGTPRSDGEEWVEPPHLTDMGNAQRLHHDHGRDLRYCKAWKRWQVWDGARWQDDEIDDVVRLAKMTVRGIYLEAANAVDEESRKALAKHALRSEAEARVLAAIGLAETEPGIPARPVEFDRHPWLLTCRNGTLDLRTGELLPHSREHLITKLAPVVYDPDAECPLFLAFLERIMAGNEGLIRFLQRAIGYSLTGDTSERVLMILYGEGRNGKSTLLEVIRGVLGDYAVQTPTETLMVKRENAIPNDVAALRGARFVSASEADEGRRLAEATIKTLTGGDTISARFMRGEFFNFTPEFKLWLGTNHKPVIRGTDRAIWDRIRLVPFAVRIPDEEQDKQLRVKLLAEAPGVLAWAVRGCLDWQRDGLGEPQEVKNATAGYRAEMDVLGAFLEDRCVVQEGAHVSAKALYAAYQEWCDETGEKPLTQKAVGLRLAERGLDSARLGNSRTRTWLGIGLKTESDPPGGPNADVFGDADASGRDFRHNPREPESRDLIGENASKRVRMENASAKGRVCVHCGDPLLEHVSDLYCERHRSKASRSEPEGYDSSSLPWDDIPATDDDPEDDPWRR